MNNESTALAPRQQTSLSTRWRMAPGSLGEAMEMATLIANSDLCPKAYKGKAADCIVAYEYGAGLGLSWMQALRWVAVINGIPSIYGDAIPALIYGSGECERFHEYFEGEKGTDGYTAVCIMKRRGFPDEVRRTFSVADAKKAGLWGKQGPWSNYTDRMQQFRARGFTARDTFADKLAGLVLAEEAMDYPAVEGTVVSSEVIPTEPKSVQIFGALPEPVRDRIEKGFAELNLSNGARLAKINEWFGGDGIDPEAQATGLLDWLRDEFAKRRTGQPRRKVNANGKEKADVTSAAATGSAPGSAADPSTRQGTDDRSHAAGASADPPHTSEAPAQAPASAVTPAATSDLF